MMKLQKQNINNLLVSRYQEGDDEALKILIKRFHSRLISSIAYHTGNRDIAEDLAQECWCIIISKLKMLKLEISFEAFAMTIAKRKSIDWIRRQQVIGKNTSSCISNDSIIAPESGKNTEVRLKIIKRAILELMPTHKIILTMFYLENKSLKEISKELGVSEGTVKSRLFYARESLKKIVLTKEEALK
jgi:RNA polymerase sigma factor (sigma-70 family)